MKGINAKVSKYNFIIQRFAKNKQDDIIDYTKGLLFQKTKLPIANTH